jgi:hypothetical protein
MPEGESSKKVKKKLIYQRPALIPLGRITARPGTACAHGSVPRPTTDARSITDALKLLKQVRESH